jgi:ABC-type multidrug transport system permease subunit
VELAQEIDRLKGENEKLIKEIGVEKHFGKYLAGGVVFLAVWVSTYFLVLLPTIKDSFIACMVAILISLIFGFLVGFKRYDWILRRFLELFAAIAKK